MGKIVIRKMENNPLGYRCPTERGLQFKDVNIETSDGENLHGWFIYNNNEFRDFRNSISKNNSNGNYDEGKFFIFFFLWFLKVFYFYC